MTIEKQTIVDQIEITRDGTLQIRFGLLLIENGVELSKAYHRATVSPIGYAPDMINAVNADLLRRGLMEIEPAEVARIFALVPVVHNDEAKEKYRAMLDAQIAALVFQGKKL